MAVATSTAPEPTAVDIDQIIDALKTSWTASITVRRRSRDDIGYREIFVSVDDESIGILKYGDEVTREVAPGTHRLKAHNTLFRKSLDFSVNVGEHASFRAINRAGFGTYSVLAFFIGGGPIYLTLEREEPETHGS
ncbi:MAG: hypothetical protein ABL993_10435 [Vicinamibacterales bacterium]